MYPTRTHFEASKSGLHGRISILEKYPTRALFEASKSDLKRARFRPSKCVLNGHISRRKNAYAVIFEIEIWSTRSDFDLRNVFYTDTFRDSEKFLSQMWFGNFWIRVIWAEMCLTRTHFGRPRARRVKISHAREPSEMCPTRAHFGFKMKLSFILSRAFSRAKKLFKFWLQNFWNIDEIEAELV